MTLDIRKKYFSHFLKYCCDFKADHRFVMLSGGIDSFMLLSALMQKYKPEQVTALIIRGVSTPDYTKAQTAAKYYGVESRVTQLCIDDYLNSTHLCRGTSDISLFQLIFRIAAHAALSQVNIKGCPVYEGDGADSLYGNQSPFIYLASNDVAESQGVTKDEAREILRRQHRHKNMTGKCTGTAKLFAEVTRQFGGTPVQPWVSGEFEYILDVPLSEFRGPKKKWVCDGLVSEWGVNRGLVDTRSRISMQQGTGFYDLLSKEICKKFKTKSANTAVKFISKGLL
ncbi:MAG: asparagine synthase-related protein [Pirellulales bacterium]